MLAADERCLKCLESWTLEVFIVGKSRIEIRTPKDSNVRKSKCGIRTLKDCSVGKVES